MVGYASRSRFGGFFLARGSLEQRFGEGESSSGDSSWVGPAIQAGTQITTTAIEQSGKKHKGKSRKRGGGKATPPPPAPGVPWGPILAGVAGLGLVGALVWSGRRPVPVPA